MSKRCNCDLCLQTMIALTNFLDQSGNVALRIANIEKGAAGHIAKRLMDFCDDEGVDLDLCYRTQDKVMTIIIDDFVPTCHVRNLMEPLPN